MIDGNHVVRHPPNQSPRYTYTDYSNGASDLTIKVTNGSEIDLMNPDSTSISCAYYIEGYYAEP